MLDCSLLCDGLLLGCCLLGLGGLWLGSFGLSGLGNLGFWCSDLLGLSCLLCWALLGLGSSFCLWLLGFWGTGLLDSLLCCLWLLGLWGLRLLDLLWLISLLGYSERPDAPAPFEFLRIPDATPRLRAIRR